MNNRFDIILSKQDLMETIAAELTRNFIQKGPQYTVVDFKLQSGPAMVEEYKVTLERKKEDSDGE